MRKRLSIFMRVFQQNRPIAEVQVDINYISSFNKITVTSFKIIDMLYWSCNNNLAITRS